MTDPFYGEIQMFAFNYSPADWAFCNGALIPIRQNPALYSLLGTQYGGDGVNTFQLPNLVARGATHQGAGPGLTPRVAGETFGQAAVSLTTAMLPAHRHDLVAYAQPAAKRTATPVASGALSMPGSNAIKPFSAEPPATPMSPTLLSPAGGGQPHENRQPYLAVNFCIALHGNFPQFE
ncbi:phage tail protein [Stenotrophomonas maltophilia]|nr:phage tail protein [Stenotrophomonas maltophilia]